MKFKHTAQDVAKIIRWPLKLWPGNCFSIASAMVESKIILGKVAYGYYHGFISDSSKLFAGHVFYQHAWVVRKTTIVDPTRWVFENCDPYIHVGLKDDEDYEYYDISGNRVRNLA